MTRELCLAETEREARELADRHLMLAYGKEYGGTWKHPFIDARRRPISIGSPWTGS